MHPLTRIVFDYLEATYGPASNVTKTSFDWRSISDRAREATVLYAIAKKRGMQNKAGDMIGMNRNTIRVNLKPYAGLVKNLSSSGCTSIDVDNFVKEVKREKVYT
jgi:hypothetical protein